MPTTKVIGPTAIEILTAVHRPSSKQRSLLRLLPTTAAGVLVTLASAPLVVTNSTVTRGPKTSDPDQPELLVWPTFIANTLGLSEATVRGHLKSLTAAGLTTARNTPIGVAYAANGPVILAEIERQR